MEAGNLHRLNNLEEAGVAEVLVGDLKDLRVLQALDKRAAAQGVRGYIRVELFVLAGVFGACELFQSEERVLSYSLHVMFWKGNRAHRKRIFCVWIFFLEILCGLHWELRHRVFVYPTQDLWPACLQRFHLALKLFSSPTTRLLNGLYLLSIIDTEHSKQPKNRMLGHLNLGHFLILAV